MNSLIIPHNERILVVIAHPDDELLTTSLLRLLIVAGCTVKIICLTRGEGKHKGAIGEAIAETRLMELHESCSIIGIDEYSVWYVPDGEVETCTPGDSISRLSKEITVFNPYWIVTFAQDGWTHHKDHQAVHHLATQAAVMAKTQAHMFGVTTPAELNQLIMPGLKARRKTMDAYNDSVVHPNTSDVRTVTMNQEIVTRVAKIHHSQQLESYLKLFEKLGFMEYYLPL